MNDKKIELISAKGAMGVTEFALLYFPESPLRLPIKGCGYGYGLRVV